MLRSSTMAQCVYMHAHYAFSSSSSSVSRTFSTDQTSRCHRRFWAHGCRYQGRRKANCRRQVTLTLARCSSQDSSAKDVAKERLKGTEARFQVAVQVRTLSGAELCVGPFARSDTYIELTEAIMEGLRIPVAEQNLTKDGRVISTVAEGPLCKVLAADEGGPTVVLTCILISQDETNDQDIRTKPRPSVLPHVDARRMVRRPLSIKEKWRRHQRDRDRKRQKKKNSKILSAAQANAT